MTGKDVVKEEESHGTLPSVVTTQAGREGHLMPLSESDTGPNEANLENPDFVHEIDLNNEPFTKPSPTERALNIGQGVGPVAGAAWLEEVLSLDQEGDHDTNLEEETPECVNWWSSRPLQRL